MTRNEFMRWGEKTAFRHRKPVGFNGVDVDFGLLLRVTADELEHFPDGAAFEKMLQDIAEHCATYIAEARDRTMTEVRSLRNEAIAKIRKRVEAGEEEK